MQKKGKHQRIGFACMFTLQLVTAGSYIQSVYVNQMIVWNFANGQLTAYIFGRNEFQVYTLKSLELYILFLKYIM